MELQTVCLIIVGIAVGIQGALYPLVNQCCSLGVNFATQTDGDCRNLPLDDFNLDYNDDDRMSCLAVIEVCCYETRNNQSCETGKAHAIQHGRCDNLQGGGSCASLERECCGCCKLGQVASKEGLACEMSVIGSNFGDHCSATFSDCCNLMTSNATTGSETDGHGQGQGNGNNQGDGDGGSQGGGNGQGETTDQSLCARFASQLCDQICVDVVDEAGQDSFRCECEQRYELSEDQRNCVPASDSSEAGPCATQNPCDQICTDTGLQVQCSCNAGHSLDSDGKTCNDIDECAVQGTCSVRQLCVNTVGSFRCEDGGSVGSCANGMAFNTRTRRCEDIDECTIQANACPAGKQCVNTVGSFRCEEDTNTCGDGHRLNPRNNRCEDINECIRRQDSCTEGQQCVNTVGSYYCRRTVSCGTGYTLDEQSQGCVDVDECRIGTDNCGDSYECKNSPGSFRCEIKERDCPVGSRLNYRTGICERVTCTRGMRANSEFNCVDIDECSEGTPCAANQRCVNTRGSYRCINTLTCYEGFQPNAEATFCEDIDECAAGTHTCDTTSSPPQTCVNEPGRYQCKCPQGYRLNPTTKQCDDEDECTKFGRRVCSIHARCENAAGSYRCVCKEGFESRDNGRTCSDKNECLTPRLCQHTCSNTYGSYECRCNPGYKLAEDKRSCRDINECSANYSTPLAPVCIGLCHNTPGSFQCTCPQGYTMGASGRQCQDIDECLTYQSRCSGENQVCVNTRGGYRCNDIQCPPQFFMPANGRQRGSIRCQRLSYFCRDGDEECKAAPLSYTYNFLSFPSRVRIPADLFTMRSRSSQRFQFDLRLLSATGSAKNSDFKLIKVNSQTAMVRLISKLEGPQEVELQLDMNIYYPTDVQRYIGKAVAKIFIYVTKDPWEQLPGQA